MAQGIGEVCAMNPSGEREAQYADELVAGLLDPDERGRLLEAWASYLVDREQIDSPIRHRDFIIGYMACYRAHDPGPKQLILKSPEPGAPDRG